MQLLRVTAQKLRGENSLNNATTRSEDAFTSPFCLSLRQTLSLLCSFRIAFKGSFMCDWKAALLYHLQTAEGLPTECKTCHVFIVYHLKRQICHSFPWNWDLNVIFDLQQNSGWQINLSHKLLLSIKSHCHWHVVSPAVSSTRTEPCISSFQPNKEARKSFKHQG